MKDRLKSLLASVNEQKKSDQPMSANLEKQIAEVQKIVENAGTKHEKPEDSWKLKDHILNLEEKIGLLEEEN